jgi:hypothetical protein
VSKVPESCTCLATLGDRKTLVISNEALSPTK